MDTPSRHAHGRKKEQKNAEIELTKDGPYGEGHGPWCVHNCKSLRLCLMLIKFFFK